MAGQRSTRRTTNYYMKLPYAIELRQNDDGTWFARIPELRGCMTEADTVEEVLELVRDAQREWVSACLEDGTPIPEPQDAQTYSGQFRVRVPRSLHEELAERAQCEGTSLNQMIVALLSRAVGAAPTRRLRTKRAPRAGRRAARAS